MQIPRNKAVLLSLSQSHQEPAGGAWALGEPRRVGVAVNVGGGTEAEGGAWRRYDAWSILDHEGKTTL